MIYDMFYAQINIQEPFPSWVPALWVRNRGLIVKSKLAQKLMWTRKATQKNAFVGLRRTTGSCMFLIASGRPEDFFPASLLWFTRLFLSKQASILSHCHGENIEFITPWGHRTRISRVLQKPMMIIHKKDKYPAICPETMIKTFLPSSQHVKSIISRNPSTPRPPREAITSTAARITCAKWR